MQITFNFRDAELVRQGLEDLAAEIPKIGKTGVRHVIENIATRMKQYPARISTYVRTYRFYRGWQIEPAAHGYRLSNKVPYGHYVVGDAYGDRQAWMHQGIWRLFREVTDEEVELMPDVIWSELNLAIRRNKL